VQPFRKSFGVLLQRQNEQWLLPTFIQIFWRAGWHHLDRNYRVVLHSTLEFLERGRKSPKVDARAQFDCIPVHPSSHPIPPALRFWRGEPKVPPCPLKAGHREVVILVSPETNELMESSPLLSRIRSVPRPDLKANPKQASRTELIGANPSTPWIRNRGIVGRTLWIYQGIKAIGSFLTSIRGRGPAGMCHRLLRPSGRAPAVRTAFQRPGGSTSVFSSPSSTTKVRPRRGSAFLFSGRRSGTMNATSGSAFSRSTRRSMSRSSMKKLSDGNYEPFRHECLSVSRSPTGSPRSNKP
jgi:hypothetical protein